MNGNQNPILFLWVFAQASAALLAAGGSPLPPPAERLSAAWQALAIGQANEAFLAFTELTQEDLPGEVRSPAELGCALSLLQVQPRTEDNIERSDQLLADLVDSEATDEIRSCSLYFRGKIALNQWERPDLRAAALFFTETADGFPNTLWGEDALIRLCEIQLVEARPGELKTTLKAAEVKLARITRPTLQIDRNILLAEMWTQLGEFDKALAHQQAVLDSPHSPASMRPGLLVTLGNLSLLSGNQKQAGRYFQSFLDENPHDQRGQVVLDAMMDAGQTQP